MTAHLRLRLRIAASVSAELRGAPDGPDVWIEGPLTSRLAHARSDVDVAVCRPAEDSVPLTSRMVDGVRVDLVARTREGVEAHRGLLRRFDVGFESLESFRVVRGRLGALTALRTAARSTDEGLIPILDDAERDGYRRWVLADRVQVAMSAAEDLLGLHAAGLRPHAAVAARQLMTAVEQAEVVAAGAPLLGEKWLPSLRDRYAGGEVAAGEADVGTLLRQARLRLIDALLHCWPVDRPAVSTVNTRVDEAGWLPQRFADGWFAQLGDERVRLSGPEVLAWRSPQRS